MPSSVQPMIVSRDLERLVGSTAACSARWRPSAFRAEGPAFFVGLRIGDSELGVVSDGNGGPDGPQRMLLSVDVPGRRTPSSPASATSAGRCGARRTTCRGVSGSRTSGPRRQRRQPDPTALTPPPGNRSAGQRCGTGDLRQRPDGVMTRIVRQRSITATRRMAVRVGLPAIQGAVGHRQSSVVTQDQPAMVTRARAADQVDQVAKPDRGRQVFRWRPRPRASNQPSMPVRRSVAARPRPAPAPTQPPAALGTAPPTRRRGGRRGEAAQHVPLVGAGRGTDPAAAEEAGGIPRPWSGRLGIQAGHLHRVGPGRPAG